MYEGFLQHRENMPAGIEVQHHGDTTQVFIQHDGYDVMVSNGLMGLILVGVCIFICMQRVSPEPYPWLGKLWTDSDDATFICFIIATAAVGVYFFYVAARCLRQRSVLTVITIDNTTGEFTLAHRYPSGQENAVKFSPDEVSTRKVVVGRVPKYKILYGLQIRGHKKSFLCYSLAEPKQQWMKDFCSFVSTKTGSGW